MQTLLRITFIPLEIGLDWIVFSILCRSMAFWAPGCAPQIPHPLITLDIQIAVSSAVIDSL